MEYFWAFIVGGAICVIGQLMMDLTSYRVTPAHVLVTFVVAGALISALGLYQPLVNLAGAGAELPLPRQASRRRWYSATLLLLLSSRGGRTWESIKEVLSS